MGAYDERKQMEDLISEHADRFDPILRQLQTDNWNVLDGEARLEVLREFENLMADLQGRPPMQVIVMPQAYREENPDVVGYCSDTEIAFAPEYFEDITTGIPGIDQYTVWDAVDTVIHEGRHAWQRYMVREFPEAASPDVIMSMLLNSGNVLYVPGQSDEDPYYSLQTVEIDARKYALAMLVGIKSYAEQHNLDCTGIENQLSISIEGEKHKAAVGIALADANELDTVDHIAIERAREAIDNNVFGWDQNKLKQIKALFERYVESGKASLFEFWRNAYQAFEESIYSYLEKAPVAFYDAVQVKQVPFRDARSELLARLDKLDEFGIAAKKSFRENIDTGMKP